MVPICTAVPSVPFLPFAQQDSTKDGVCAVPLESYLFVLADCSALTKSLRASMIRSQAGALLHAPVAWSRIKYAQAGFRSRADRLESCIGQDLR